MILVVPLLFLAVVLAIPAHSAAADAARRMTAIEDRLQWIEDDSRMITGGFIVALLYFIAWLSRRHGRTFRDEANQAIAIAVVAANRQSATLRYLALALFGVTLGKMFTVDLLELDGVYRITGFIGLGLVLLAASFLYQRQRPRASGL